MTSRAWQQLSFFLAFAVASVVLVLLFKHSTAAESVDIYLHYSLADLYAQWFSGRPGQIADPITAMYPPLAHALAGVVTAATGVSAYLTTNYVGMVSLFAIYFFIFLGVQRNSVALTLVASLSLAWIISTLRFSWSIYGFEIIGNFFYGQVASEAVFLATLYILATRKLSGTQLWVLPVWIFIIGWVFPMGQIKCAGGLLVLRLFDAYQERRRVGYVFSGRIAEIATLTALFALVIGFHPAFRNVLELASNEGGIDERIGSLLVLRTYFVGLAVLCLAILWLNRDSASRFGVFIAAAGLATAGMALLQDGAHVLTGAGSVYGVRKHTYATVVLLICGGLVFVSDIVEKVVPKLGPSLASPLRPIVAGIFGLAITVYLLSAVVVDRSYFIRYQREIRQIAGLQGQAVSLNESLTPTMNFIASTGDLNLESKRAVIENLGISAKTSHPTPTFAVVSPLSPIARDYDVPEYSLKTARVVRYNCR